MVLQSGKVLRAIEIGLLAEVGHETVHIIPTPRVAVLATGNELVPAGSVPGPGQIRNSNGPLLEGLVSQAGGMSIPLGIARDEPADLQGHIELGLERDILLLSGGVSAGVLDLVPQVLAELGVEQIFHKVNLKPGKPLWFGVKRHPEQGRQTLVFGLPGNPVSGLVCFELFVRPAIEKLSGREPRGLPRVTAILTQEHKQRGDRPTYWPAQLRNGILLEGLEARVLEIPSLAALAFCSSELTTPLTGIIGFAEVLQGSQSLSEKERRYAENILKSGRLLKDMLNDVLSAARNMDRAASKAHPDMNAIGDLIVTPLPWQGSGDLRTLTDANCLAYFPAGDRIFRAGEQIDVLLLN
jgi:molybdenum cofactor synthesis domain-containing protein